MRYRHGKTVHDDGVYSVVERVEDRPGQGVQVVGFSLLGPDVDPFWRYEEVGEALAAIRRLRGLSSAD